jgi:hypothetical protein
MKVLTCFLTCAVTVLPSLRVVGNAQDMALPEKVDYCALVAEIHIDSVRVQRNPDLPNMDELVCSCSILQPFKPTGSTNSVTITFNYLDKALAYDGKTFVVFAFRGERGYRPYGGQGGLVEKGHPYYDLVPPKTEGGAYSYSKINYVDLIQRLKVLTEANKQGGADGRQPFSTYTNRTSAAAASRRSP